MIATRLVTPLNVDAVDAVAASLRSRANTAGAAATSFSHDRRATPTIPGVVLTQPQQRLSQRVDREDPRAEQRELISLQMKISDVVAAIKAYDSEYRLDHEVASKDKALVSLEKLYTDINTDRDHVKMSYTKLKGLSDDTRQDLKDIQGKFLELGKDAKHNKQRADLNLRAIEAYKFLLKTQIRLAQLKFKESTRPLFDSQTALQLLHNASNSADLLIRELNWRKNRIQAGSKIREMQTLDFLGQTIWNTSIANLDISIRPGATTIRQQIWINPHARLSSIMKDLRASEISIARDKLQDIISLYSSGKLIALAGSSAEVNKQLQALDQEIQSQSSSITDAKVLEAIKQKVKTIQALIPEDQSHPIQKDITFSKDEAAGLRSRIHILKENYEDFVQVAKTISHIEDLSLLLTMASKRQLLSKTNKAIIDQDLGELIAWTERGKVYPKQFAKTYLQHIPGIIENGFTSQKETPEQAAKQYQSAAAELKKAASQLIPRLAALVRISAGTKGKLDALYTELKDADIQGRASLIVNLFNENKLNEALEQIQTIKSQYFSFLFPEPGYIRASQSLNRLEDCVRRAAKGNGKLQDEVKYLADLIVADIEHKNQLRLTVVDFDEESPYRKHVFPNQHITPFGLTKWLHKQFLSTGNGWKSLNALSQSDELNDLNKGNILLASQLPSKMKAISKSLPVIAT